MFLSRIDLNPHRRGARALLASPQRLHAAVLAAFPQDRAAGRVLWRIDEGGHDALLYVVSPDKPDLNHVVEEAGRPEYGWQTREYGPFLDRLAPGQRWAFRLTANPVHNVKVPGSDRGRRYGHVTVAQQTTWLVERRAGASGFAVAENTGGGTDLVVRARRTLRFDRRGRTVTLATAVFEGTLTVTDADALRAALTGGIGPAKGYGCGLLTLAAPSS